MNVSKPVSPTNETFIKSVFGPDSYRCHVTGFTEDPTQLDVMDLRHYWAGGIWKHRNGDLIPDGNNFFTISVFDVDPALGDYRRRKANYAKTYCIVLDDVLSNDIIPMDQTSAKVPRSMIKLNPSWELETSPNNLQVGYIIRDGDARGGKVSALLDALVASGLVSDASDPGMKGVTRYVRLPVGTNTKAKYGAGGFKHRVRKWRPDRTYTLEDIADAYGVRAEFDAANDGLATAKARITVDPDEDWQLKVLSRVGSVHSESIGSGGVPLWNITCPHVDQHSGRADSGTVYMGGGAWDCRHRCSQWCDHDNHPQYHKFDEKLEELFPDECRDAKREVLVYQFDDGKVSNGPESVPQDTPPKTASEIAIATRLDAALDALKAAKARLGGVSNTPLDAGRIVSGDTLMAWNPGDIQWVVDDMISPGLTAFAGQMKVGKSFLLLQIMEAVSSGKQLFGRNVRQGRVLYYAIEDGSRRIRRRMGGMKLHANMKEVNFIFDAATNPTELAALIAEDVAAVGADVRLVIVDTFKMASGARERSTLNAYEQDVEMLTPFKKVCEAGGIALLATFHERKADPGSGKENDHYAAMSGSAGIGATVDGFMRLMRQRESREGSLYLSGRDKDEETVLEMEQPVGMDGRWNLLDPDVSRVMKAMHRMRAGCKKDILQTIIKGGAMSRKQVQLDLPVHSMTNIRMALKRLKDSKLLTETDAGILDIARGAEVDFTEVDDENDDENVTVGWDFFEGYGDG